MHTHCSTLRSILNYKKKQITTDFIWIQWIYTAISKTIGERKYKYRKTLAYVRNTIKIEKKKQPAKIQTKIIYPILYVFTGFVFVLKDRLPLRKNDNNVLFTVLWILLDSFGFQSFSSSLCLSLSLSVIFAHCQLFQCYVKKKELVTKAYVRKTA